MNGKYGSNGGNSVGNKNSKLQLTDGMKQALVLQDNISEDGVTTLWNSVINAQET